MSPMTRPKAVVFIPAGLDLTLVSALGTLLGAAIPGLMLGVSPEPGVAAALLPPDDMPPEVVAGHLVAAAELLSELNPDHTPAAVDPGDMGHTFNRMTRDEDGGLTVATGAVDAADLKAREFALQVMAAYAPYFESHPEAENYVEYEAAVPTTGERYTLTVRKPGGRTPHEMRKQAEAERDKARATLQAIGARIQVDDGMRLDGRKVVPTGEILDLLAEGRS